MIHKTPLVTWGWIKHVLWRNDIFEGTIFVGGKIDMGKWDEHGMKFYVKGWLLRRGTGNIPFWTSVDTAFLDRNKDIQTSKNPTKTLRGWNKNHFFCHLPRTIWWESVHSSTATMTSLAAAGISSEVTIVKTLPLTRINASIVPWRWVDTVGRWELSPHPVHCGWGDCQNRIKRQTRNHEISQENIEEL